MKSITLLLLFALISSQVNGQKLDFEELPSVPEFSFRFSYKCHTGTCWIAASSTTAGLLAVSTNNESFKLYQTSGSTLTNFSQVSSNNIICYNRSSVYLLENDINEINKIEFPLDSPNELITSIFPTDDGIITINTTLGLYQSSDMGKTFILLEQWPSESTMKNSIFHNDLIYSINTNPSEISIDVRNKQGNLLNKYTLDFEPFSYTIAANRIIATDSNQKIHLIDITTSQISEIFSDQLGEINIPYSFKDTVLLYNFYDRELLLLDGQNILSPFTVPISPSLLFGSLVNTDFYLHSDYELYDPISLSPLQFDTIRPDATATKVISTNYYKDVLYSSTEDNLYKLLSVDNQSQWSRIYEGDGGGFGIDHQGHIYIYSR